MAVDLAKYVVSLEAETSRYTQQLESANRKLEGFETRNKASLTRMGSDFRRGFTSVQRVLAGFGVVLSARALGHWIADAIKAADVTDDQRRALDAATTSWKIFHNELQTAAASLAANVAPAFEKFATFLRKGLFPTEAESIGTGTRRAIEGMEDDLKGLMTTLKAQVGERDSVDWLERLVGMDEAEWDRRIAKTVAQIKSLETSIKQMRDSLRPPSTGGDGLEFIDTGPISAQRQAADPFAQMDQDARVKEWEDSVRAGQKLTEQMATDVEKQVAAWKEAKELLAGGFITPETLRRLDEEQLQFFDLNEIHAKLKAPLKQMETDAQKTAQSIGMSFQNAFADWILGADRSFSDLLKRMAAQMATSAIFKGLASLFEPTSFFANFFGGFRAEGGPVSAGRAYVVGENGPELFMPNHSGMIAAGGGGGLTIINNIDARGADPSAAARLPQILAENNQRLKAEIRHERNRGR